MPLHEKKSSPSHPWRTLKCLLTVFPQVSFKFLVRFANAVVDRVLSKPEHSILCLFSLGHSLMNLFRTKTCYSKLQGPQHSTRNLGFLPSAPYIFSLNNSPVIRLELAFYSGLYQAAENSVCSLASQEPRLKRSLVIVKANNII